MTFDQHVQIRQLHPAIDSNLRRLFAQRLNLPVQPENVRPSLEPLFRLLCVADRRLPEWHIQIENLEECQDPGVIRDFEVRFCKPHTDPEVTNCLYARFFM